MIAVVCHEANRVLQADLGDEVSPPWAELDEETRESAFDGVAFVLRGGTPEEAHANWLEFKTMHGWVYGPRKDLAAKTHPCMVDYDDLPAGQKKKDDLFHAIVNALRS